MDTKPTDDEILAVLREHTGINPTYYVKNVLKRVHKGLETPFVLRRLKALETAGKVVRRPSDYSRQICWNIAKEAA
jgi:hypothetical protein